MEANKRQRRLVPGIDVFGRTGPRPPYRTRTFDQRVAATGFHFNRISRSRNSNRTFDPRAAPGYYSLVMRGKLVLACTRSMEDYLERVAYHLKTFPEFHATVDAENFIGKLRSQKFADGEMEVEVHTSLRGKDVFLLGTAARNAAGLPVSEAKMELYHSIDALRRAQAGRITLVEPFCSCARSDRTTRRNSVGFWMHYKTLAGLGLDHMVTYQLHSDKSRTVVDPNVFSIDDIPAIGLLEAYISDHFIKSRDFLEHHVRDGWLFCSVDAGGENVARRYARAFGAELVIAHKSRDYKKANTVDRINILTDSPIEGKEVWVVDDMIDTGGSVYALVRELKDRGVKQVNVAAIHPVFSGPAVERLQQLHEEQLLDKIVVADTVSCTDELREQLPFLHVVSSARLTAEIIMRMHEEKSLAPFFEPFDAWEYLSALKLFL